MNNIFRKTRSPLSRPGFASRMALLLLMASAPVFAASPMPNPADSKYITVTEKRNTTPERFNQAQRRTRHVEIVGWTVVLDPDSPDNNMFASLDNQQDIKELAIYSHEVVIRGRLRLPQTRVVIITRLLRFESPDGSPDGACIITTPVSLENRPLPEGAGLDGADGHDAGDVYLSWSILQLDPRLQTMVEMNGGDGQHAGFGRDGNPGASMPAYDGSRNLPATNKWPEGTVWIYTQDSLNPSASKITYFGKEGWPGNGEDAVPAGVPGNPGRGGNLYLSASAEIGWVANGGQPGLHGKDTVGGEPGEPRVARHVRYVKAIGSNTWSYQTVAEHVSEPGSNATAPRGATSPGASGNLYIDANAFYLHPKVLLPLQQWAADLVAAGDIPGAIRDLDTYLADFAAYKQKDHLWHFLTKGEQDAYLALEAQLDAQRRYLKSLPDRTAVRDWTNYR